MRMKTNIKILLLLFTLIVLGCQKQEYETDIIPINELFKNPKSIALKLSPSGDKIALLKSWHNRLNIFVKDINTNKVIQITKEKDANIKQIFWISETKILYLVDKFGNDNNALVYVSLDGTDQRELTNSKESTTYVINVLPEFEDEIIIQTN